VSRRSEEVDVDRTRDRRGKEERGRSPRRYVAAIVAVAMGACTGGAGAGETTPSSPATAELPQPSVPAGVEVAPLSERVDLAMPTFSHPTDITNPLFPVSDQASVLMLGHVEGKPFRTEVTLLPETRIVRWEGQEVETAVSQYVAFLGGRIEEVAYDLYAQADDGSVWYFGEDVFDFRDGTIVVTEGTWLAGRDGPAAMIMPADPQVGDVYRTENAPGFVFEEVTVGSVSETLDGPLGPIQGGMLAEELHIEGGTEDKTFAPGYGEFYTSGGGDVEALALAVSTDASDQPVPAELTTISDEALAVYDAAGSGNRRGASTALDRIRTAWDAYRGGGDVPRLVEPWMDRAVKRLTRAVEARDARRMQHEAIEVARSAYDLQLRFRLVSEIDLARMDLWAAQLLVDEAAGDDAGVAADAFALDYVRDRIRTVLDEATLAEVNTELGEIQIAVVDEEPAVAAEQAAALRRTLRDAGLVA
jgi:hypothetical protein